MNEIIIAVLILGIGARYAEKIREIAPITDHNSSTKVFMTQEV